MHGRAIAGAVVGHHRLHPDPVISIEGQRPAQEADRGLGLLVRQDLGVGKSSGVVDRDVDELPAGKPDLALTGNADASASLAGEAAVTHALARDLDPPELLDVDVNQLTGALFLVAPGGLEAQSAEPAHPEPRKDRGDGRQRHRKQLRELGGREAQPAQRSDRGDAVIGGSMGNAFRRRGAVEQPQLAFGPVAGDPLGGGSLAHLGGLGRLAERPSLLNNSSREPAALVQAERGVSVELHPATSLSLGGLSTPSLQGGPDEQRG